MSIHSVQFVSIYFSNTFGLNVILLWIYPYPFNFTMFPYFLLHSLPFIFYFEFVGDRPTRSPTRRPWPAMAMVHGLYGLYTWSMGSILMVAHSWLSVVISRCQPDVWTNSPLLTMETVLHMGTSRMGGHNSTHYNTKGERGAVDMITRDTMLLKQMR